MTDGILAKPIFLIVHLFSGRRRSHDVHWHLAKLAEERGIEVAVLSMDTAVSPYYGDLTASSVSWQKLAHLYEQGLVAATVCGAPCETFRQLDTFHHLMTCRTKRSCGGRGH